MVLILLCVLFVGLLCPVRPAYFLPAPWPGSVSEVSLPPGGVPPSLARLDVDDDRDESEDSLSLTVSVAREGGPRQAPRCPPPFAPPPTAPPSLTAFCPLLI